MHKIDFVAIIEVQNANPNGDPLMDNYPRTTLTGLGEISDVCIKRKIRNQLLLQGQSIFVQSNDGYKTDAHTSLAARFSEFLTKHNIKTGKDVSNEQAEHIQELACKEWIDTRLFGQLLAFKGSKLSIGIRGPVTIQPVLSIDPVNLIEQQITKSVNGEDVKVGTRASDTMGTKKRIDFGMYVLKGSISPHIAKKTGVTVEDTQALQRALLTLFEGDESSARPSGSMRLLELFWFEQTPSTFDPLIPSYKVHDAVRIEKVTGVTEPTNRNDYTWDVVDLPNVTCTRIQP